MSYVELLHSVPDELRRVFRRYETIRKKLINIKWSCEFNSICLKENILPNFSRIRHRDPAVSTASATTDYRRYLVEREIGLKKKKKYELENSKMQCEVEIDN